MTIRFTKMQGLGNDYIYVDAFQQRIDDPESLARTISDRHFGVGSDGLILIAPPENGIEADVRMRMYNADGGESEMCGNGVRCVCKFAHDRGISRANPMRVQTGRGVLSLQYRLDDRGLVCDVTVDMGEPILDPAQIPVAPPRPHSGPIIDVPLAEWVEVVEQSWVDRCGLEAGMTCVSMGNPHAVLYCGDVSAAPLERIGRLLERHPIFPRRTNVHVAQVHEKGEVTMRTWERGSGATMACGTGAAAVCVAGVLTGRTERVLRAHLPGGDLDLEWEESSNHVLKTGPAVEVFEGTWVGGEKEGKMG